MVPILLVGGVCAWYRQCVNPRNFPAKQSVARRPSRWMWGGILFIAWTVLAFASILQIAIAVNQLGQQLPWRLVVPERLIDWYTCALFTPVCFWLARRYPITESSWRLAIPGYLLVTCLCIVLKTLLMVGILHAIDAQVQPTFVRSLSQNFIFDSIALWCVIAVIHVLELRVNLSQREHAALELRAQLSEAELQLLKTQLQPHFLFNTLNGVASLIHTAPNVADAVVVQLADLLRASLDHDAARTIPLSAELALLDKYLAVMHARFEGRISVHRNVDQNAQVALVPQFLLQPLVENVFEHGFGRRAGAGNLWIRIWTSSGSTLHCEIADDGAGLFGDTSEWGVGLSNTQKRLRHLYGATQSLQLVKRPEGGAMVRVELPLTVS